MLLCEKEIKILAKRLKKINKEIEDILEGLNVLGYTSVLTSKGEILDSS